jgi:hypothetical protein
MRGIVRRGKPLRHVLSSPEAGKIMDNLDRCRATGQVIELEDVALLGKGQRKWDLTLAPIFDEQTRVTQIIITARETTEKKLVANLVRESWERYRLIADKRGRPRCAPRLGSHLRLRLARKPRRTRMRAR